MNPRASCKRPGCPRVASCGLRGLCHAHHDADQRQRVRSGVLLGRGRVDAGPAKKHLAGLLAAGVSPKLIAAVSGLSKVTLWRIPGQKTVSADTAARILRVSDEMQTG